MKKIFLVACVFLLAACVTKVKDDYRSALPQDASAIFGFNPKSLGNKMNAGDFAGSSLAGVLDEALDDNGVDEADRGIIMSLLADPKQSGLSMKEDIYFFVTKEKSMCILAKVDNRDKISATVKKAGVRLIEEEGRHIAGHQDDETALAVYDNRSFLFYSSDRPYAESAPELDALLAQKAADGLMGVKHVAGTLTGGNDFCAVANYGAMTELMDLMPGRATAMMPSYMEDLKDAHYIMTGNFEKGRVVADMTMAFSNKESEKKYMDFASKLGGKMKGSMLKYIPEGSLAAFSTNIKGSALYEQMMSISEFKRVANRMAPIKAVMESIEGDMAMALTGYDATKNMPSFVALVALSKPDVILGYSAMAGTFGAKPDGENGYVFNIGKTAIHFGVKDNMFYATNDDNSYAALNGENIASIDGPYGDVFRGYGSLVVDINSGGETLSNIGMRFDSDMMPLLDMFGTLEVSSPELGKTHIVLTTADKNKNAAEVIYATVQTVAKICAE